MTLNEKINFLENISGKIEDWDNDAIYKIASSKEAMDLFDADLTSEVLKHDIKDEDTKRKMYTLDVGYKLRDSNIIFKDLLEKVITNQITETQLNKKLSDLLKKPDLSDYDRINIYIMILSGQISREENQRDNEFLSLLNKEEIKTCLDRVQEIIISLDIDSGLIVSQGLITVLYRIQEYYFEIYKEDLLVPIEGFEDRCEAISDLTLKTIEEKLHDGMLAKDAYKDGRNDEKKD